MIKINSSHLPEKMTVSCLNRGLAQGLKPEKISYILKVVEGENNGDLPESVEVGSISQ